MFAKTLSLSLATLVGAGAIASTASAQDYRDGPPPPPYDCSRVVHDNSTTGTILGALAGAALGSNLASHHGGRSGGAAIGGVAGALVGNSIGRGSAEQRCYGGPPPAAYYRQAPRYAPAPYGYAPPAYGYAPAYAYAPPPPPPAYYYPAPAYYYPAPVYYREPYYGPSFAFSFGSAGSYWGGRHRDWDGGWGRRHWR